MVGGGATLRDSFAVATKGFIAFVAERPDEGPLVERLRRSGIDVADPEIIATTGWTTDELWDAMDRTTPAGDWAVVSLLTSVAGR